LKNNGTDVFVLSATGIDKNYFGFEEEVRDIDAHFIRNQFKAAKDVSKSDGGNRLISRLKSATKKMLVPDVNVIYSNAFTEKASEIIRNQNISYCLISSPPHSMQLIGTKLRKKFPKLFIIVDYRDSWNTIGYFKRKNPLFNSISQRMEKKAIENADLISYVSRPMKTKLEKLYSLKLDSKSVLVMNGYTGDSSLSEPMDKIKNEKLKIGYFGSLISDESTYRNIKPLLEVINSDTALKSRIEVHLYGEIQLLNVKSSDFPFVSIHKSLPYTESVLKMQEMDLLLILHTDQHNCDEVVTGKFFDYVQSGKPMLVASFPEMEAFRLCEEYKLGFGLDLSAKNKASRMHDLIDLALTYKKEDALIDRTEFHAHRQFEKLIQKAEQLSKSGNS
jgi:hypothetical protein